MTRECRQRKEDKRWFGMGNKGTKITEDEMTKLVELTTFDKKEIEGMYKQVMKKSTSGVIELSQFCDFMKKLGAPDDFVAQLLFGVFDENGDGFVDFKELITTLSIGLNGSNPEKMEMIFKVYDIDGDGFITKTELLKIFRSVFKVRAEIQKGLIKKAMLAETALTWESADEAVNDIFAKVDMNNDGKISFDEWKDQCSKDIKFLSAMNFFDALKK